MPYIPPPVIVSHDPESITCKTVDAVSKCFTDHGDVPIWVAIPLLSAAGVMLLLVLFLLGSMVLDVIRGEF